MNEILKQRALDLHSRLVEVLSELNRLNRLHPDSPVTGDNGREIVEFTEGLVRKLLTTVDVYDMGGCPLCRS